MAHGRDTGPHPGRRVPADRFRPAKGGTTSIDVPGTGSGVFGFLEESRIPIHTTTRATYPDTKIEGGPVGPYRRP